MTVRERIELALRRINGDIQQQCFRCCYKPPNPVANKCQEELAFALTMMGVPHGVHRTFVLDTNIVYCTANTCGKRNGVDPDWQRFIEEVESLVV